MNKTGWIYLRTCPACGDDRIERRERLKLREYRFGDEVIEIPDEGIGLVRCQNCGLLYKNLLPSPTFLAEVFARQAGEYWSDDYGFEDEKRVLLKLIGDQTFDLLDVGAANGGLLKALALGGTRGRLSALDVMMYPSLKRWIRGEFIKGLVEDEHLSWSGEPYDVVTMFDVAEHLYNPKQAFANLQRLVKPGGFIVAETGDSGSFWPKKIGTGSWWYAVFFEHHVFWSRWALENIASRYGFRVYSFVRKRHKGEKTVTSVRQNLVWAVKSTLYWLAPAGYLGLARAVGKKGINPYAPFARDYTRDHFRVVLQRIPAEEQT